ncbi:CotH kinase family protein [Fluviispira vulneris]|uniref:CotH kinase family protein n=1 Tax=Fluviispira vulneris TaxID=2763012 RepID=UPI001647783B|nr:CotH kinase family protein [Fluviispira vulneris]
MCYEIKIRKILVCSLAILLVSCGKLQKKEILLKNANTYFVPHTNAKRKVYIDNKNGIIIVHGLKKISELEKNKDEIIFQYESNYDLYVNKILMKNSIVTIADILSAYKNELPIEIPIHIKNKVNSTDEKVFLLTFSRLPILEIKENNILKHPVIRNNSISITKYNDENIFNADIKINIRGKGSVKNPKSSYAIYGDDNFSNYLKDNLKIYSKSNEYSLLSSYNDSSFLREKFAHDLFNRQILGNEIHETIRMHYVDVFIEGEYVGVYALMNTLNPSDLVFENKDENKYSMLEMNAQNLYSIKKSNEKSLSEALLGQKVDFFSEGKLHNNASGLAPFANRNVLCHPDYVNLIDKKYGFAYLSTILALQAVDNITNNVHLAIHPALSKSELWNKEHMFLPNFKIYYIPWDLDMSLGAMGWKKEIVFQFDVNNYNKIYNYNGIFTKPPYNVPLENQASLLTCYTRSYGTHVSFKDEFNKYWLENKEHYNGHFSNIRIKKELSENFNILDENGAYAREFKRWSSRSGSKFSTYDLNQLMGWIDNRLSFVEKEFLKIDTKEIIKYKKKQSVRDHSNINVIHFDPKQVQLSIETKEHITGQSDSNFDRNIFNNAALTITDLYAQDKNNIAGLTGGFFEYWYNGKFVHYQDNHLDDNDINNHFKVFNDRMIHTCDKEGYYPKDGVVTLPIGILKINNKWYTSEENLSDVVGWNEKGEYIIDRVKVVWDVVTGTGTSLFKNLKKIDSNFVLSSPKINVFRSDAIDQDGSPDYISKNITLKRETQNIVIYFDTFSDRTRTPDDGLEIIVENNYIREITHKGNNIIPKNGFVVSISKEYIKNSELMKEIENLQVGTPLHAIYEYLDANNKPTNIFDNMTFIRGKVQALVLNKKTAVVKSVGNIRNVFIDSTRKVKNLPQYLDVDFYGKKHPRTALCFRKDLKNGDIVESKWSLVLVDGRQRTSFGMRINELSDYLVNHLKCDDAINLDGGSSANMIAHGLKMNVSGSWRGYCSGIPRPVSDAIVLKEKSSK